MIKIWVAIKKFFGFGASNENDPNELAKLMRWISSKERIDACTQTAFQAIQKNDTVQQEKEHPCPTSACVIQIGVLD